MYFYFGKVTITCLPLRLDFVHDEFEKGMIEYAVMRKVLAGTKGFLICFMDKIQYQPRD